MHFKSFMSGGIYVDTTSIPSPALLGERVLRLAGNEIRYPSWGLVEARTGLQRPASVVSCPCIGGPEEEADRQGKLQVTSAKNRTSILPMNSHADHHTH